MPFLIHILAADKKIVFNSHRLTSFSLDTRYKAITLEIAWVGTFFLQKYVSHSNQPSQTLIASVNLNYWLRLNYSFCRVY